MGIICSLIFLRRDSFLIFLKISFPYMVSISLKFFCFVFVFEIKGPSDPFVLVYIQELKMKKVADSSLNR